MGQNRLPEHLEAYKFKPGQSGNPGGRQRGVRHRLSYDFLIDLHKEWQAHGADAITRMRLASPGNFVRTVASILPRNFNVTVNDYGELSDTELLERIRQRADELGLGTRPDDGGAEPAPADPPRLPKPD